MIARWLMKLLERTPPTIPPQSTMLHHDMLYPEAREAYEREKDAARRKVAEQVARVQRLGYDFDNITRRGRDVAH